MALDKAPEHHPNHPSSDSNDDISEQELDEEKEGNEDGVEKVPEVGTVRRIDVGYAFIVQKWIGDGCVMSTMEWKDEKGDE